VEQTAFPLPFFHYGVVVQDIIVRLFDFKVEVCHVILYDFRRTAGFLHEVAVHAPDAFVPVLGDEGQGVIDVVGVVLPKDGVVIRVVLPDGGALGRRMEQSSESQQLGESVGVIRQFAEPLIRREDRVEAQFL
jgi:hypothetical protein